MSDRPGIIYIAVNRVNGKAYVGLTTKALETRAAEHKCKARLGYQSHFYSAIRRDGFGSFDFAILESCDSLDLLRTKEKEWIAWIGSRAPIGYNLTDGGQGTSGLRGKSEAWRRAVTSPEYRKRHSDRVKLLRGTEAYRRQNAINGRRMAGLRATLTEEERERWRVNAAKARRGIPAKPHMFGDSNPSKRPEVREKIRLSKLGRPRPEELKKKLSEIAKARYERLRSCAQS